MANRAFDLKGFRENSLKMTQEQFAKLIGVRQDAVSRMEKNPSSITVDILDRIVESTGVDYNDLRSYKKEIPEPLKVGDTWKDVEKTKKTLLGKINEIKTKFDSKYADDLECVVKKSFRKPKVTFLGRSDSGKSTMINALLGANVLPAKWTPTTSILVYIKHKDEKPAYMEEDLWLFRQGVGSSWDDSRLDDEEYCRMWKIAGGNAEMLSAYGTHMGEKSGEEVGAAVLFADSAILCDCDLIDVPGLTGGLNPDNEKAGEAQAKADILVYLSPANGFLDESDMVFIRNTMDSLTRLGKDAEVIGLDPLANLYIVATQAHIVDHGNEKALEEIRESGAERLFSSLSEKERSRLVETVGKEDPYQALYERFFAYTTDIESVRRPFEEDFTKTIEKLPLLVQNKGIEAVKSACETCIQALSDDLANAKGIKEDSEKYREYLEDTRKNKFSKDLHNEREKNKIIEKIKQYERSSMREFREKYKSIVTEKNAVKIIDKYKLTSKAKDLERLGSYMNAELKDALEEILTKHSQSMSADVESYISEISENLKAKEYAVDIKGVKTGGFDVKKAFASGLAGAAAYGGLAIWASSLGNLGGYILVAKGVSLLAAAGIHIGGTAAAISAISAIGGPIAIAIGLALLTVVGTYGIFSGGWKKRAGKKLCEAFEQQEAFEKYSAVIEKFWDDTEKAFMKAAESMESEWDNYLKEIEAKVEIGDSDEDIENQIVNTKESISALEKYAAKQIITT